jgi:hypothetical protein
MKRMIETAEFVVTTAGTFHLRTGQDMALHAAIMVSVALVFAIAFTV